MYKLFEGKKAAYFTLGCKLNFAETSTVGQQLRKMGVSTATRGEVADICIINTCRCGSADVGIPCRAWFCGGCGCGICG